MGYDIIIENQGRGVVVIFSGVVTAKDITTINKEIYTNDRLVELRYQIWDFTKAMGSLQVSAEDARSFAIQDGRAENAIQGMRIALVGKKEYFAGIDTLYGAYADVWAENIKYKFFDRMKEARLWACVECGTPRGS